MNSIYDRIVEHLKNKLGAEVYAIFRCSIRSDQIEGIVVWSRKEKWTNKFGVEMEKVEYANHTFAINDDQVDLFQGHYMFSTLEHALDDARQR